MVSLRRAAIALLILLPCLVHAPELFGFLRADPALSFTGLGIGVGNALLPGLPLIDPSIGSYHEALGFRAIDDLLHGKMPWRNLFEGVGVPLAGEMNSSPFYPLMPLLELPRGYVVINIVVQILAGIATFALLCRLRIATIASLFGAMFFEFNGTFAWLSGGWGYALPALPLLVLGLEYSLDRQLKRKLIGMMTIAFAIALSISAGFIEIAFLDGLFGVGWAIVRLIALAGKDRAFVFGSMVGSAMVGLMLAAPILIAFFDYLRVANVGMHTGAGNPSLNPIGLTQLVLPYAFGQIFQIATIGTLWGSVGGYAGDALCVLAIYGVFGRSRRSIRVYLALWIILCLGATFGQPLLQKVFITVPGVRYTAYHRYLNASWEFAMTVLAAFAIDDMLGLPARAALTRMVLAVGILFACVAIPFQQNAAGLVDKDTPESYSAWFATSIEIAALTIALLVVASFCKDAVRRTIAIGIIVGVQIVGYYALPSLSYPRDGRIELGSVGYLRAHLGLQRFYSLGPLAPNYGSYYGAASINHNDLPIAKRWVDNVVSHLDPCINPIIFTGTLSVPTPSIPGRDVLLTRNVREFEKTGVKFVVTSPDSNLETKRLHARCRFVRSSSARADEKRPGHLDDGERSSGSARPNKYSGGKLPEHFGWDTACNCLRRGALLSHASRASYVNRHTAMPLVFTDRPLLVGGSSHDYVTTCIWLGSIRSMGTRRRASKRTITGTKRARARG